MNIKQCISTFGLLTVFSLTACNDGPAENIGESIDNAAFEAEGLARDAVGDLENAATDAANAVEDACENISDQNC